MTRAKHIPRVYLDRVLNVGDTVSLPDDKRHHLTTVLRLGAGAALVLFNDSVYEYDARLIEADRKRATLEVLAVDRPVRESSLSITLIQAVARGDRMDFALAKAVELGVTAIQPVLTERGQVKLDGARLSKKQAHWQRVVESAAEQSGRLICPPLAETIGSATLLSRSLPAESNFMLAPGAARRLSALTPALDAALWVGPESGLSAAEIDRASAAGWQALALGPRVLRTETAGMAALAALQTAWGDLGG